MVLSAISIRRPVLATVMSLIIILIGIISFTHLSVREYPNIDAPVVSVRTVYTGASAEIMESQVTQPIEDALAGIEGIKKIKSVSREQVSEITIEFVLKRDADNAANDVRDRVARARSELPDEADDPVVSKVEADAQAVIWIAFSSDKHSSLELSDYADRFIIPRLQVLEGVASVIIGGERRYAMRIWLDRDRLADYSLTPQDVESALRLQNVEVPSGRIESTQREFTVLTQTDLRTVAEFNQLIIKEVNGYPIRLSDVGYAAVGPEDERRIVRVNGQPAVGLGVVKQSTANTLSVAQAVRAELPYVTVLDGMKLEVVFDTSIFIEASIDAVYHTMGEAFVLVVLVIFAFLRSFRVTFIPFVTIPVSLIGAFIFLDMLGFSINILTLLGLVLAIGIVVDDAIVMLENIHRHVELGKPPLQAAIVGSQEIGFAVISMTITLAAVFVPLTFMTGNTGRLFTEFALTVSAAVIVSGFVALTLTPMMCSKMFKSHEHHGFLFNITEQFFVGMNNGYRAILKGILKVRWFMIIIFGVTIYGAIWIYPQIKQELAPTEDRSIMIGVLSAPEGSTLEYTDKYARQIEQIYAKVPEIRKFFVVVAPGLQNPNPVNSALSFVSLVPWGERTRSQQSIVGEIMPKMLGLPGVLAFALNPPSLGQSFRNPPVQFIIQGDSYEQLQAMSDRMLEKIRAYPGMTNVDTDLKLNKPQLVVTIDRDKVAAVGVEVEEVGRTLETLLGGRQVTRFKREGKQYDVIVQLNQEDRTKPTDLSAIFVRNKNGKLIQLSNLVKVTEAVAPKELNRFDRLRSVLISANVAPNYSLKQALDFLNETAKETLDATAKTGLDGQSREFMESGETLVMTFILALVFIYLVLAAQFESFVSPLIIMLTVPLAMTGALFALYYTHGTLNVYSQIGLVMLIGLITRHGILIVEFSNQLQEQGKLVKDAVIEAAVLRLRPILMTSLSMILGTLPLAISTGAGAESRQQIGWVILGGLILGTFLTLFIIPVAYTLLARRYNPDKEHAHKQGQRNTTYPAHSIVETGGYGNSKHD
ncbi:efflux RND transporter permease subunit [Beggiatoa leptomitoformis]|uniref:MMPL family transporter n=1 Tax=Beggiatoa leptomitoformis TaxID=288004 RepID=A0A2N9YI44_9GAMM|nr:efflux RND transporter permease subunit [Beggiatoa leptomitoformis]ALG67563.1 MMPL family transporter [Beggiatoa leptomitoformis]AUI70208.1 MMPL family transporter [Beggiatoa leptomitoformis]